MAEAMSARRAGGRPPEHGRMAARLSRMLKRQIDALEAEPVEGFSETKVKALLLLAKALQSMQDAGRRDRETGTGRDNGADKVTEARDIVEFRNELERRIAALGPVGPDGGIPGGAGSAPAAAAS